MTYTVDIAMHSSEIIDFLLITFIVLSVFSLGFYFGYDFRKFIEKERRNED